MEKESEKNAVNVLEEELRRAAVGEGPQSSSHKRGILRIIGVPFLAIFTGLILGGIIIVLTSAEFYSAWRTSPIAGLAEGWRILGIAYSALFTGAFGSPSRIIAALQSGDNLEISKAFYPFFESLVAATPYIFGGLGVALGFRAGLFQYWSRRSNLYRCNRWSINRLLLHRITCSITHPVCFSRWCLGWCHLGFYSGLAESKNWRA